MDDSMQDPYDAPEQVEAPPEKKGGGCLLWGCVTALVLVVVGGGALYWVATNFIQGLIDEYTEAEPRELPVVEVAPEEVQEIRARWDGFRKAVDEDRDTAPLELSSDDLNALIQNDPEFAPLKGHVHIELEDGKARGEVSIPLDDLPFPADGEGRFFNGIATFDASMENGVLIVTIDSAEVKGEPVPQEVIDAMKKTNIAEELHKNADNARRMRRIERIEIRDGKLRIVPREAPGGGTSGSAGSDGSGQ